jgi:putative Holliday junction resolvase
MLRGRRVAFDYGDVRIGVAVSDPDSILATPLTTLLTTDKKLETKIVEILNEIEPVQIFVGKPLHMDGTSSQSSAKAAEFIGLLSSLTSIPVRSIDERLSTVSASRNLRSSGVNSKSARGVIDQAAAVEILELALEIEKRTSS